MRLNKTVKSNIFYILTVGICVALTLFIIYSTMEMIKRESSEYNELMAKPAAKLIKAEEPKSRILILNDLSTSKSSGGVRSLPLGIRLRGMREN